MDVRLDKINVPDLMVSGTEPDNIQMDKKLLEDKENTIQVLKKNIKVKRVQHVQLSELMVLQQEKEKIPQEMMDYKHKVLKFQEENQAWEVERLGLILQISVLNTNQRQEEEVLEELKKRKCCKN